MFLRLILTIASLTLLISACACQTEKKPEEVEQKRELTTEKKIFEEEYLKETVDDPEDRPAVRQAAKEFVKRLYPESKIEGIAALAYTGTLYLVSADLSFEDRRETINIAVRLFFKDNGEQYWRAEKLDSNFADLLSQYTLRKYKEKSERRESEKTTR